MHAKSSNRIPFDQKQYYYAMIGLLGRVPDKSSQEGFSGLSSNIYQPKNEVEREKFKTSVSELRQWLDGYDIIFSGSDCSYHENDKNFGEHLCITIAFPIED